LAGVHSTISCTSASYFTTARPIGHVVQCESVYICFLGTNFDLFILIEIILLMFLTWKLAFGSIWVHVSFEPWPSRLGKAIPVLVRLFKLEWQLYNLYVHGCEWNGLVFWYRILSDISN
jgi:hypothetical protein